MNKQGSTINPAGGIEWTHFFGPGTGWTANPVRGCKHQCAWRMPDGNIAICYAKSIAVTKLPHVYTGGFEQLSWDPTELQSIEAKKEPCGIFIDSMSDLFGQQVSKEWIVKVLETVHRCPQHVFFSLTKNASRLIEFTGHFPAHMLVGVSSPPSFMYGKELVRSQQDTWFRRQLEWLWRCEAPNTWVSLEPLTYDISTVLADWRQRAFQWAVIGAASNGPKKFQPRVEDVRAVLAVLAGLPVFFKGNVGQDVANKTGGWRAEFPVLRGVSKQSEMAL